MEPRDPVGSRAPRRRTALRGRPGHGPGPGGGRRLHERPELHPHDPGRLHQPARREHHVHVGLRRVREGLPAPRSRALREPGGHGHRHPAEHLPDCRLHRLPRTAGRARRRRGGPAPVRRWGDRHLAHERGPGCRGGCRRERDLQLRRHEAGDLPLRERHRPADPGAHGALRGARRPPPRPSGAGQPPPRQQIHANGGVPRPPLRARPVPAPGRRNRGCRSTSRPTTRATGS